MLPILQKQKNWNEKGIRRQVHNDDGDWKQNTGRFRQQQQRRPGRVALLLLSSFFLAILLCCHTVVVSSKNMVVMLHNVELSQPPEAHNDDHHLNQTMPLVLRSEQNGTKTVLAISSKAKELPSADEPPKSRTDGATILECHNGLLKPVSKLQKAWKWKRRPLLHSMLPVTMKGDGEEENDHVVYKLLFLTRRFTEGNYAAWTMDANWTCDDEPAIVSNHSEISFKKSDIFILTCPIHVKTVKGYKSSRQVEDVAEYDVGLWRNCSDREIGGDYGIRRQLSEETASKVVCTMFAGQRSELEQWIVYHRLIGFDHFLIYMNEPFDKTEIPNEYDITYIPWNYDQIQEKESIPHQAAQQHDCILRAQQRNVTWLALHDTDEYFHLTTNNTLDDILSSHEHNHELAGLQFKSWFFGSNNSTNKDSDTMEKQLDNIETDFDEDALVIDSVWRGSLPYPYARSMEEATGTGREKMIVRPDRITYFACHKILVGDGITRTDEHRIRLNHYKKTERKRPFWAHKHIVYDTSLRDAFGSMLRQRLGVTARVDEK